MSGIFLCYRRADSAGITGRISDRLVAEFGKEQVFMDVDHIQPGENFVEKVETTVGNADALIAIIGPQWMTEDARDLGDTREHDVRDFVRLEIGTAFKQGVRVIPVLIDDAKMPHAADLPRSLKRLAHLNALEVRHTRFDRDVEELLESLRGTQPHRRSRWLPAAIGAAVLGTATIALVVFSIMSRTSVGAQPYQSLGLTMGPPIGMVGGITTIEIRALDKDGNDIANRTDTVSITLSGANAAVNLTQPEYERGRYTARYTPRVPGQDLLIATFNGDSLFGDPYTVSSDSESVTGKTVATSPGTARIIIAGPRGGTAYLSVDGETRIPISGFDTVTVPAGTVRLRLDVETCALSPWSETLTLQPAEVRMVGRQLGRC